MGCVCVCVCARACVCVCDPTVLFLLVSYCISTRACCRDDDYSACTPESLPSAMSCSISPKGSFTSFANTRYMHHLFNLSIATYTQPYSSNTIDPCTVNITQAVSTILHCQPPQAYSEWHLCMLCCLCGWLALVVPDSTQLGATGTHHSLSVCRSWVSCCWYQPVQVWERPWT